MWDWTHNCGTGGSQAVQKSLLSLLPVLTSLVLEPLECSSGRLARGLGPPTFCWLVILDRAVSIIIQACSGEFGP